jgi:L-fucose isomerase
MARVALLAMSDGRDFVARDLTRCCREAEGAVAAAAATAVAAAGRQVGHCAEPVSTSDGATSSARRQAVTQPDLTIFHYPVWAFPLFTMLAASATSGPLLLGANHAKPSDRIGELPAACTFPSISFEPLGSPPG